MYAKFVPILRLPNQKFLLKMEVFQQKFLTHCEKYYTDESYFPKTLCDKIQKKKVIQYGNKMSGFFHAFSCHFSNKIRLIEIEL